MKEISYAKILALLETKKPGDKKWFLSLLDDEEQKKYEEEHVYAVMQMLRALRIRPHKKRIREMEEEIARLEKDKESQAENYKKIKTLLAEIQIEKEKIDAFRPFFDEPYFARMDLTDNVEGYNSYYIGKKGDVKLEIVDWRAPISRRYYQKSCSTFTINEYVYKTILRRAIQTKNGKMVQFKNEYLSLKDYLTVEEIGGKDEDNILDPILKEVIRARKDDTSVKDIIQTIQEQQYNVITCPEKSNFILQGCAGSGKTMVMLHRLSYLMYNNEEIKPRDVLVITPSNSFNAFIDELSQVLELDRVKMSTIHKYFLQVLKNVNVDIEDKIDFSQAENVEYLQYLYSLQYVKDVQKKMGKVYDDLYGLFLSEECKAFIDKILSVCQKQISVYEEVKNASVRVRRAVLGEIKEKKDGGLYYTKSFRELMNGVLDIQDFLGGTLQSENAKRPEYFYRQMSSFYKSANYVTRHTGRVIQESLHSLEELAISLEKEVTDLMRYKQIIGGVETYTYPDRIARRKEIIKESKQLYDKLAWLEESMLSFVEFYVYLRGEKEFCEIGSGQGFVDIVRYFYRETVKKYKLKFGMTSQKMYHSDAYALCVVCAELTDKLSPAYSYVFIDEGQDISPCEYALLQKINKKATFNVFGDVAQNVTAWRGVKNWGDVFSNFEIYTLNQNYRNTNEIVQYVSRVLDINMQPIGFNGEEVKRITPRNVYGFFKDKKGLKAIICSEENKKDFLKKSYNDVSAKGKVAKNKINVMTVYESKGLEFSCVVVVDKGLSSAERYIAYTRALKELAVIEK